MLMTMYSDKFRDVDVDDAIGFMNSLKRSVVSTAISPFVRRFFTNKINVVNNTDRTV